MDCCLLLNVVIREAPAVVQLLPAEDEALLIGRDALLVLDLRFHVLDGVRGLNLERNGLPGERPHEDLHASSQSKNQVQR